MNSLQTYPGRSTAMPLPYWISVCTLVYSMVVSLYLEDDPHSTSGEQLEQPTDVYVLEA